MEKRESVVAIADLESIPHFARYVIYAVRQASRLLTLAWLGRSAAMNITLGNAYERSGLKRNAIDAFK